MAANPTAFTDAEGTNNSSRSSFIYRDLNLNFSKHPITGKVSTLSDVEAVKRSIRNLINLNTYDKPFHPEISGRVRELLFENVTPIVADVLRNQIESVITQYERRAELIGVDVIDNGDRNEYIIKIQFYVVNAPNEVEEFTTVLERLR